MTNITTATAVYGHGRAAAGVRPGATGWLLRSASTAELCLQHAPQAVTQHVERYAGFPVTPTTSVVADRRRADGPGADHAMKINKFDDQPVPGSNVWRPSV